MVESNAGQVEAERREALNLALENFGGQEELTRRFGPDTCGVHEAMDRTWIAAEHVENYVLNSPTVVMDPDIYNKVHLAVALLYEAYQDLGRLDEA